MKILLTGANGQLGQAFQKILQKEGVEFLATDLETDITNLNAMRIFVKNNPVDLIINCAAYNAVDKAEKDWKSAYLVNGIGSRNLALIANEIDAVFVNYSSDYVFDGNKGASYSILDNPNPISKYGESKLLGEIYTKQIANKFYLIRTSWLFGKGNINFITKVLEWSRNKSELSVVVDQISSPTYSYDLSRITWDLLKTEAFGLYHISNSGFCSRFEWAEFILKKIGWKGDLLTAESEDFNTAAARPKFSVLDNFGTKETVGYELQNWKDATERFLQEKKVI
ncbi:MAG: dTDP-4-dehydrorhamnose reductase [Candidatus Hodarchaeota archaeon]